MHFDKGDKGDKGDQVERDRSNITQLDIIAAPLFRAKLVVVGDIATVSGDLSPQAL